jgi:glutathione synthase
MCVRIFLPGVAWKNTDLNKADKLLCAEVGKKLVQDGIFYAGLDIIGSKLVEVNVLSPGTITDINRLNNVKIQEKIVDYLETVVSVWRIKKEKFRPEDMYENK